MNALFNYLILSRSFGVESCTYSGPVVWINFACYFLQGVNLSTACKSGQVTFLDGLNLVSEGLDDGSKEDDNDDNSNPFRNLR